MQQQGRHYIAANALKPVNMARKTGITTPAPVHKGMKSMHTFHTELGWTGPRLGLGCEIEGGTNFSGKEFEQ